MTISQYDSVICTLVDQGLAVAREGLGFSSDLYKDWEQSLGERRCVLVTIIEVDTERTWATDLFQVGLISPEKATNCRHWRPGWDEEPGYR